MADECYRATRREMLSSLGAGLALWRFRRWQWPSQHQREILARSIHCSRWQLVQRLRSSLQVGHFLVHGRRRPIANRFLRSQTTACRTGWQTRARFHSQAIGSHQTCQRLSWLRRQDPCEPLSIFATWTVWNVGQRLVSAYGQACRRSVLYSLDASGLQHHAPASYQMHTGDVRSGKASLGSWVTYGLGSECSDLPGYVVLFDAGPLGGSANYTNGFLPPAFQPTRLRDRGVPVLDLLRPSDIALRSAHRSILFSS